MKLLRGFLLLVSVLMLGAASLAQTVSVTESMHNLSPQGSGNVKASTGYACLFCHAPHKGMAAPTPVWNHELSSQTYNMYTSSTYHQVNSQPQIAGSSKLCLSCHDGTVAVGQTVSQGLINTTGSMKTTSNLTADLRTSHPFSFATPIVDNGELQSSLMASPATTADPKVKLVGGTVECTTCHDAHTPNIDLAVSKFLVRDSSNGQLCLACHDPARQSSGYLSGWSNSAHAGAAEYSTGGDPAMGGYSTVAGDACMSCHIPHNSAPGGRLLRQTTQKATCATCHNGTSLTPTIPDVNGAFDNSTYQHPINITGLHDPTENAFPLNANRHSECADCHNSHAAKQGVAGTAPAVQSALNGVWGVSLADGVTAAKPSTNEYEVCFKCHANSTNKPQSVGYTTYGRTPYRLSYGTVADPYNTRLAFQSPVARHNVTQASRTGISPSLRANMLNLTGGATTRSLAAGTYIYCSDCHNNDKDRAFGGSAANGPHGSQYPHILERRYELNAMPATPGATFAGITYTSGVTGPYALCDKCHNLSTLLSETGDTVFKRHSVHVIDVGTSCSTCHASHGVQGGSTTTNGHLVDFDTKIVGPDNSGRLEINTAARTCNLKCHGVVHDGVANANTY